MVPSAAAEESNSSAARIQMVMNENVIILNDFCAGKGKFNSAKGNLTGVKGKLTSAKDSATFCCNRII